MAPLEKITILRRQVFLEVGIAFFLVIFIIALVPFVAWDLIRKNQPLVAAILFIYTPLLLSYFFPKSKALDVGNLLPTRKDIRLYVLVSSVSFPFFVLAAYWVWTAQFGERIGPLIRPLLSWVFGLPRPIHWGIPSDFGIKVFLEILFVAFPEEFFFRGFLQTKLSEVFSPKVSIGITSFLFAIGHVLTLRKPGSALVFFPSLLFGWLRWRTGSLFACVLFHASCNLLTHLVHFWFFS